MKRFLVLLEKNKLSFLLALIVGVLYSAAGVAIPVISGRLITAVVSDSTNSMIILTVFLCVSMLQICLAVSDEYVGATFKIRQKNQMRKKLFGAFLANDCAKREDIAGFVINLYTLDIGNGDSWSKYFDYNGSWYHAKAGRRSEEDIFGSAGKLQYGFAIYFKRPASGKSISVSEIYDG